MAIGSGCSTAPGASRADRSQVEQAASGSILASCLPAGCFWPARRHSSPLRGADLHLREIELVEEDGVGRGVGLLKRGRVLSAEREQRRGERGQ